MLFSRPSPLDIGAARRLSWMLPVGLMLFLWVGGCGAESDSTRLVERWIDELPSSEMPSFVETQEVARWDFNSAERGAEWRLEDIEHSDYELKALGLLLDSSGTLPILTWDVDLEADQVRTFEVTVSRSHILRLFWATEDQVFDEARSLVVGRPEEKKGGVFTVDVGRHPLWQGRITGLRLQRLNPNLRIRLDSVAAFSETVDGDGLAATTARPWRVELGRDARFALPAPPGLPIVKAVEPGEGDRLRLAWGLDAEKGPAVTFHVSIEDAAGSFQSLFESRLDPTRAEERRVWHETTIDLSAFEGPRRIRLETSTESDFDLRNGMPVWGNPQFLSTSRASENSVARSARPVNVVLIVIDTLRADHLSTYGYEVKTSPHIDAWAVRRGIVFENTVAASPWTLPSHVSLFSGLDVVSHGVAYPSPTPQSLNLLAERLRRAGYRTTAVTGGAYLSPYYGLAQGFDRFVYASPDVSNRVGKDLPAGIETALEELSDAKPFFLFFHTYAVHEPYDAHEPYFSRWYDKNRESGDGFESRVRVAGRPASAVTGWIPEQSFAERVRQPGLVTWNDVPEDRLDRVRALYDSGIAYADAQIGRLLQRLEEKGLEESTLVLLTSDHGESLGEYGLVGHTHLYDSNLMVPLIVSLPGEARPGRIITQVRQIDVAPTVLDVVGLEGKDSMAGRSLVSLIDAPETEFPAVARSYAGSTYRGISLRVRNRWKYIFRHSPWGPWQGRRELFDLERDPAEQENLAPRSAQEENFFREVRDGYLADSRNLRLQARAGEVHGLVLRLTCGLRGASKVKTFDPVYEAEWKDGEARFTIGPGESRTFFWEGATDGDLSLEVEQVDGNGKVVDRLSRVFRVSELVEAPLELFVGRAGRQETSSGDTENGAEGPGIRLSWHGEAPGEAEPVEIDPELKEQLLALGYIGG